MKINGINILNNFSVKTSRPAPPPATTGNIVVQKNVYASNIYYGRDLLKKPAISFGQYKIDKTVRKLSDEEYEKFKADFDEKLSSMPENIQSKFNNSIFTRINIFVADKILSSEKIYENKGFMQRVSSVMADTGRLDCAKGRVKILDKFIDDERIDDRFHKRLPDIISSTYSTEGAEAKIELLDKILSEPRLSESKDFMKEAKNILFFAPTKEIADSQVEIIDKILSDERLYGNKSFFKHTGKIVHKTYTKENVDAKNAILDNILSDEKLYKDDNYMNFAGELLECPTRDSSMTLAKKFLSDERLYSKPEFVKIAPDIIQNVSSQEEAEFKVRLTDEFLSDEVLSNENNIHYLFDVLTGTDTENVGENKIKLVKRLVTEDKLRQNDYINKHETNIIQQCSTENNFETINKILDNPDEYTSAVEKQYKKVLAAPELYVNGNYSDTKDIKDSVNNFFILNSPELLVTSYIFDSKTFNRILRMRFIDAEEYMKEVSQKSAPEDKEILKSLNSTLKSNGKPLSQNEKTDFVYTLEVCNALNCDKTEIKDMIKENRVDTGKINLNLYKKLIEKCGLSDDEIKTAEEKKTKIFDKRYLHLLAGETMKSLNGEDTCYIDIIKTAAAGKNFKKYINDENNDYGYINKKTKEIFENNGINYDLWMNPDKTDYVQFTHKDKSSRQLEEITKKITDNVEALRQTPAKCVIDRHLAQYITDDKFAVPEKISENKVKLYNFTKNVLTHFDGLFKRAEKNIYNPKKEAVAKTALDVRSNLLQCMEDSKNVDMSNNSENYDLTIKMWDRIPQKDIFQGNYSSCCIGMNRGNSISMPHYLLNGSFNMIEMTDNKTGQTIGNVLCYFVKDSKDKLAFIADNVEIRNSEKPTEEAGKELRSAIAEYASAVAKKTTGKKDIPVYVSANYNDIPDKDLRKETKEIKLLGELDCDEIYLDVYGGKTCDFIKPKKVTMLRLN